MSDVFFLFLRRLRIPLILLVVMYSVATLGMTLIPGVDDNGEAWQMGFFHAFYFVSFMGTTIGFGEIPYAFTDAQRAWVLVCIYTSVVAWLYAIGSMLRLMQDPTFQQAISERAFRSSITRIDTPFYLICGYGETGMFINRGLSEMGIRTVIIDSNGERTRSLELENLSFVPIVLTGDASTPHNLIAAGLNHRYCKGVIAITEDDHVNLQIAVSCKLIDPDVPVICRSEIEDEAENMASFGTDTIINPYLTFASRLNLLVRNPALHQLQNWFLNQQSAEHLSEKELPKGRWIICGYGRLGKAIQSRLVEEGVELIIVDPDPEASEAPENTIIGRGTEAKTLREAGIMDATVVIAASNDDANNLSILITARQINSGIYTIARVNREANHSLFVQAKCDYIMRRSQLVANQVLTTLSRPLVSKFIKYSSSLSTDDTTQLIEQVEQLTHGYDPITMRLVINQQHAPALATHLANGKQLTVAQLCENAKLPEARCLPLLLQRGGVSHLRPDADTELSLDDELLVCGGRRNALLPQQLSENTELIDSLINHNPRHIPLLRWWSRRKSA